ncbi:MAG: hypothetical protein HND51_09220 [Chloroflexi bacterium]|nr:hypothetical protein [Chloroflexota bacterium]
MNDWYTVGLQKCAKLECEGLYGEFSIGYYYDLVGNKYLEEVYLFHNGTIDYIYGIEEEYDMDETWQTAAYINHNDAWHATYVLEHNDSFRIIPYISYRGDEEFYDVLPVKIIIDPNSELWRPIFEGRKWGEEMDGDVYIDLTIDEAGDVSIYVEDVLIYSYASQSECHIEGCEIVGP